jgi:hypothetical protein
VDIDNLSKQDLISLSERISNRIKTLDKAGDTDKNFYDYLFDARREWLAGNHSTDNP